MCANIALEELRTEKKHKFMQIKNNAKNRGFLFFGGVRVGWATSEVISTRLSFMPWIDNHSEPAIVAVINKSKNLNLRSDTLTFALHFLILGHCLHFFFGLVGIGGQKVREITLTVGNTRSSVTAVHQ